MDIKGKRFHFDTRYWEKPQQYQMISLYQIGDLSCMGNFEIGEHVQPCYEISYIVAGKGEFYLDGVSYPVKAGDIFLCQPGQMHNLRADKDDPFRYFYFAFFFNEIMDMENPYSYVDKMFQLIKHPCVQDTLGIEAPFTSVLRELQHPMELSQQMLESYFVQIILLSYRNFFNNGFDAACHMIDSFVNPIVYAAISYIDNNVYEITNLSELADELNYSYSHLAHIFVNEVGISLQSYYNKKRVEQAIKLLKDSHMTINDIALKLNYQSIHSFSKAFKKAMGMAPSQYRVFLERSQA